MMTENSLILHNEDTFISPATSMDTAVQRYEDMRNFINNVLRENIDYGVIPGAGNKPTLLKPGAEKLASFFGLSAAFVLVESQQDWTGKEHNGEQFFFYWYKCILSRGNLKIAEGEGSANSMEKKYRYRSASLICPACGNETIIKGKNEYGGGWLCYAKKGGCGAKFKDGDTKIESQPRGQVLNPDLADTVNTLQKMAQKRALVAAVLIGTNASDYFTQDIEDMSFGNAGIIEAEFTEIVETTEQKQPKAPAKQAQTPDKPNLPAWIIAVENSNGEPYWTLTTEKLSHMANSIQKALAQELTDDKREEYERKAEAIRHIIADRNEK